MASKEGCSLDVYHPYLALQHCKALRSWAYKQSEHFATAESDEEVHHVSPVILQTAT